MVETSEDLKALQVQALGATFAPTASYSASRGGGGGGGAKEIADSAMRLPRGGEIFWHSKLEEVRAGGQRARGFLFQPTHLTTQFRSLTAFFH